MRSDVGKVDHEGQIRRAAASLRVLFTCRYCFGMKESQREDEVLRCALKLANMQSDAFVARSLTGGCIHRVLHITLEDGRTVVAKINSKKNISLFEEEVQSLRAIDSTHSVPVPQPLL